MSLALTGKKKEQAEKFYDRLIETLLKKHLPFMVGGTYAFNVYTGLDRPTGDIDIKTTADDFPKLLKALNESGFKTELTDVNWLAKVLDTDGFYTDIIFAERNGLHKIDKTWFVLTREGTVLTHKVQLEPVEEMIRSKLYVQNRHRADMGDVIHLMLRQGKTVDWKLLLERVDTHWELLMAAILQFIFIYPSERNVIPKWVITQLMQKLEDRFAHPPTKNKITRGLLLSDDYQVGVSQWGFKPVTDFK